VWAADTQVALSRATGIVIATPPWIQSDFVDQALRFTQLDQFILEKPLSPTPVESAQLLGTLRRSGKRLLIGYTFLYCDWFDRVGHLLVNAEGRFTLTWTFMAHHFAAGLDNWKRRHSSGGGVLRFYGVHVLAMLARYGYRAVESSSLSGRAHDQPERWQAVITGPRLPKWALEIDSRSAAARFEITADGSSSALVALSDPFRTAAPVTSATGDRRIAVLSRMLQTLELPDLPWDFYEAVNNLWAQVETRSAVTIERPRE
jgi:predicted dehydrogenase